MTSLIFAAIVVLGVFSVTKLSVDLYPDMDTNTIMIMTSYSGASASDIEQNITRPLENTLNSVEHLKHITSRSSENISKALKAGASGAVLKSSSNDELIGAILMVASGEQFLSADIEHLLEDDPPLPDLSPRQIEILDSIARGLTNKDIASQLDISLESVKSHIKIILEKLGAASRTEAASIAQRKNLLKN